MGLRWTGPSWAVGAWASLALATVGACAAERPERASSSPIGEALAELRAYEAARRADTDFTTLPGAHRALGPDPIAVVEVAGGFVGLLGGTDSVVALSATLEVEATVPAPALASGLTVLEGDVVASGRGTARLLVLRREGGGLVPRAPIELSPSTHVRALGGDGGAMGFAVDDQADWLVAFDAQGERARVPTGAQPIRVVATRAHVVVATLVDHSIEVFARDAHGLPVSPARAVLRREGPTWGLAAQEDEAGELFVALAAVEDAPLDRSVGSFGYVDSVLELWRVPSGDPPARLATFEAGAASVVMPKAIALDVASAHVQVRALAAGSDRGVTVRWRRRGRDVEGGPVVSTWAIPPGTRSAVFGPEDGAAGVRAAASPLLDAFWAGERVQAVSRAGSPPRSEASRLGEALLTTTLLAPDQSSEGARSRFTCETCHFELGTDGRTHRTGREDDTAATTKPLFGLFNGGPHFTRAMDPDLTAVAHNEVRVANQGTGRNPWFAIDPARAPWLAALLGPTPDPALLRPLGVRRAMVEVLADLAPAPNAHAWGRTTFTALERAGAEVFEERCVSCHAARLVANDASTDLPFDAWEGAVFSEQGPIVWARDGYERTGVLPYVHPDGARTTSLRRVVDKRPYFTNGSVRSLDEVLLAVTWSEGSFQHATTAAAPLLDRRLDGEEREALLAFLQLL